MNKLTRYWLGITLISLFLFTGLALAQEAATPAPNATPDRLAPPPTVPAPNVADEGAQLFWLHCQPCHGDRGQGLTDEWRNQYPPEDRYCWDSGCHGARPYENGFVLPTVVPAIIGDKTLPRFQNLAQVYGYIRVTMPFEFPGTLTNEEYVAITAFLARAHGLWDETSFSINTLEQLALRPPINPTPGAAPLPSRPGPTAPNPLWIPAGVLFILILAGGIGVWLRKAR